MSSGDQLIALNPWIESFFDGATLDGGESQLAEPRAHAIRGRAEAGISRWNAWATGMLNLRPGRLARESFRQAWNAASAVDIAAFATDGVIDAAGFVFPGTLFGSSSTLDADVWLSHARIHGGADFSHMHFQQQLVIEGARFEGDVALSGARFGATVEARTAHFLGTLDLSRSIWECDAWLRGCSFDRLVATDMKALRDISFGESAFHGPVDFSGAEFGDTISFDNAVFQHHARFERTRFIGKAWFTRAEFKGDASFGLARFTKGADLEGVIAPNAEKGTPFGELLVKRA